MFKKLFGLPHNLNLVAETYIELRWVQNVRLFLIALLAVSLIMCTFVIGKLIIVYFIVWAIFFMLLAIVMLSCATGRQNLENKMLIKMRLQDRSIKRLPTDQRTTYWRTAIRLYSIALPYYSMCLVMFFYPSLYNDIACQLQFNKCEADLTGYHDPAQAAGARQECLDSYFDCPNSCTNGADYSCVRQDSDWRWPLFYVTMWMPLIIVFFELYANRIQMRFNHISYQFIMWFFYMFATFFGEVLDGGAIFPRTFNWECNESDCWMQLIVPMFLMLVLQLGFFILYYYAHIYRNKWLPAKPKAS